MFERIARWCAIGSFTLFILEKGLKMFTIKDPLFLFEFLMLLICFISLIVYLNEKSKKIQKIENDFVFHKIVDHILPFEMSERSTNYELHYADFRKLFNNVDQKIIDYCWESLKKNVKGIKFIPSENKIIISKFHF